MLIHALLDNKTLVRNGLTYTIYDGYFDGTTTDPKLNFFESATVINTGFTSDLTNLETATNNAFGNVDERSLKISGFFRAKKTGTYRFYTRSYNASFLFINQQMVVNNGNQHGTENQFGNINMTAGTYYQFDVYYGTKLYSYLYPPVAFPSSTNTTVNTLTVTGQLYGNGTYTARTNNTGSGYPFNAVDKDVFTRWRSANAYPNPTTTTITNSGDIKGEWFQIQLPNAIILDKFYLRARNTTPSIRPRGIVMLGSNTGLNDWEVLYSSDDIGFTSIFENVFSIDVEPQSYSFYRFIATSVNGGSYYEIWELELYDETTFSCGYLEPLDDGTTTGSTNPDDFITDALGLDVFYLTNYSTSQGSIFNGSLVYNNDSLYGSYKINLIGLYVDRSNFATTKDELLFISSPQLYVPGSGSPLLVLHEEPVSSDSARKDHHIFSDEFELDAELNGKIELTFKRRSQGVLIGVSFNRALLVMQAKLIKKPEYKKINKI